MSNQEAAPNWFCGRDFACDKTKDVSCFLHDDGEKLHVKLVKPPTVVVKLTAVDCPFGTSAEFLMVLNGGLPETLGDPSLATRATERWLREHVGGYQSVKLWDKKAKKAYPRVKYFVTTSHVQPSVGLRMVPKFLHWLLQQKDKLYPDLDPNRCPLLFFQKMRQGNGVIVEAHPRMFLYSAIEKQFLSDKESVTREVMYNTTSYKSDKRKGLLGKDCRRKVYKFLSSTTGWLGLYPRILPKDLPEEFFKTDHYFDAFLSALTAWAHYNSLTIPWNNTENMVTEKSVFHEGHILVLSTDSKEEKPNE
jgi:hypothetical protein